MLRRTRTSEGIAVAAIEQLEPRLLLSGAEPLPPIVINEIHYDPDVRTDLAEFVELYNAGTETVDLSDWALDDAVEYTFPAGTELAEGQYIVVAEDPATMLSKFGVSAHGPWTGRLDNDGDRIALRDDRGVTVDEVDYKRGFPWPTVGDSPGYSIELVHPALDNDLGGSWRPSTSQSVVDPVTLINEGALWDYRKGTSEASDPIGDWRELDFSLDETWHQGRLSIGYGEGFITTPLNDMRNNYSSVFLRKSFEVADPATLGNLVLEAVYDDGLKAWINGEPVKKGVNVSTSELAYNGTANGAREDHNWNTFTLEGPDPSTYLQAGTNVLAIQLFNSSLGGSSDCFLDVRLKEQAGTAGAGPTPGARNAAYAENIPPQMRQAKHSPNQPASGEDVKITVKVTDDDGVQAVTLHYQLVDPGNYIELGDPEYQTNWTDVPMTDDGTGGDEQPGDSIYTAVLPGTLQTQRRLVRYRITSEDTTGLSRTGPYDDDPAPNFAYFVYDGVPAWSGAIDPDSSDPAMSEEVVYDSGVLTSMPVYHLITKKSSVEHSQWIDRYGGDLYKWTGTLIYDGEVYDHIHYRARGGCWRYAMGKNMWKFDFNRGHYFQARDDYGQEYDTTWDKLNFSACIQQGDYQHRGEQGMFEAASFKLFNLMGVEAPKTHWVHFRVIDEAGEAGPTQYDGDFWGLYMVIEQMDGRFLDEHDLPDGNLYKIEGHNAETNNQGPTAVDDKSDFNAFKSGYYYDPDPTEQWWRDNVDLASYYGYRAVIEGIHHGDVGYGKNYFFYLHPETGIWTVLPWDVDLTWANNMYGNGEDPFKNEGRIFNHPAILVEYKNRLREFHDLLYNAEQMNQLLDELASFIDDPAGGPSMVDADRAMWDYNPIMTSSYINLSKAGEGRFYQKAATKDFPGMVQIMKDYVVSGNRAFDSGIEDPLIPDTPTITYTGSLSYPINRLTFQTSPFSDDTGSFAAMEWRIAEVTDPDAPAYDPDEPVSFEITAVWASGEITTFSQDVTIPPENLKSGHAYRVRVRMKDSTGRCSHWSDPIQFIAGEQDQTDLLNSLRITEVMYNPAPPPTGSDYKKDDFEFIEVCNVGEQTLDLTNVSFTKGVAFSFGGSAVTTLAPGQFAVVVRNLAAFQSRYNTAGMNIAGEFAEETGLDNGGERITLLDAFDGTILKFTYSDEWYPITDGGGFSLTIRDPHATRGLWGLAEGWQPSSAPHGTPGAGEDGLRPDAVVINEILAHSDEAPNDWIELLNTTDEDIDIGGWFLSDSPDNLEKYRIADGTQIQAGKYYILTEDDHFGPAFALSELGEELFLTSADAEGNLGGYREHVDFGASERGVTFGRYIKSTGAKDFTLLTDATRGDPNADPLIDLLVINELMYHPVDPEPGSPYGAEDFEFVELVNRSGSSIVLTDYYIGDGIGFTFGWYGTDEMGTAAWTFQPVASATWTADLPDAGDYEVLVWLDNADGLGGTHALDSGAHYEIHHLGGPTTAILNQNATAPGGQWVSLGTHSFEAGLTDVTLTRGSDDPDERTLADQVKFVRGGGEVIVDNSDAERFSTIGASVTTIEPGGYLVLVKDLAAFQSRYDTAGMVIAGEYTGNLSNAGEKVKLYRVTDPDPTGYIPYILSDYVNYKDSSLWPDRADGKGSSLSRLAADEYGNDPANWAPSTSGGTPGSANVTLDHTPPTVPADLTATVAGSGRIDLSWTPSTDPESGVDHYVVYRNGAPIDNVETASYSDLDVSVGVLYTYRVAAVNPDGFASDPSAMTSVTIAGIVSAAAPTNTTVRILFTEALDRASAEDITHYAIDGATIGSAGLEGDDRTVVLTTSPLLPDTTYTVTVNEVQTVSGNTIPANAQATFQYVSWDGGDIGAVSAAGSHVCDDGTWTIEGSGEDIWNYQDEFHYVYRPLHGDGEIIARVVSLTNTDSWAKVGVMVRNTLADNSSFGMTVVTPGNGVAFQRRPSPGGGCSSLHGGGQQAPYWVRLIRSGSTLLGYSSADGAQWNLIGSDDVELGDIVYFGLCVTAHNDGAICRAVIDNVTALQYAAPDPTADIVDVVPDPRGTPVDEINIVFDRSVTGFDLYDLSLARDGGAVLFDGGQSLSTTDNMTYTLSGLAPLTAEEGTYSLALKAVGSNIADIVGNVIQSDATEGWQTDTTPPTVTSFQRNDGNDQPGSLKSVAVRFSEDVSASLDAADLLITAEPSQTPVVPAAGTLDYDPATDTGRWDLTDLGLSPGYYTLSVLASGVTDAVGTMLDGDQDGTAGGDYETLALVAMPGDVDLDGDVDFLDYVAVKGNFGHADALWTDGDFDGNGEVDFLDYVAAKGNFGNDLNAGGVEVLTAGMPEVPPPSGTARPDGAQADGMASSGTADGSAIVPVAPLLLPLPNAGTGLDALGAATPIEAPAGDTDRADGAPGLDTELLDVLALPDLAGPLGT